MVGHTSLEDQQSPDPFTPPTLWGEVLFCRFVSGDFKVDSAPVVAVKPVGSSVVIRDLVHDLTPVPWNTFFPNHTCTCSSRAKFQN